jgi:hypothetical protein
MRFNRALLLLPLLGACAAPAGQYPSLALRDAERATGTLEPAAPEPYVPPPTPSGVLDRLQRLTAEASSAHEAFLAATPQARTTIAAGRGTDVGSEAWARAQVALAGLEAARSRAMIALADLDRLYVDAAVNGEATDRIVAARETVATQVEQEDTAIAELAAALR